MTIYVDADACPVKEAIVRAAKKRRIPVFMFIDTSHILEDGYSTVVTVDKGADSVDFAIVNRLVPGDVLITQDYGLASMALAKKALVINQNGMIYNSDNIDRLLFERHLSKEMRSHAGRMPRHKKRENHNNISFERNFMSLLQSESERGQGAQSYFQDGKLINEAGEKRE